jgi:hypothetical protein
VLHDLLAVVVAGWLLPARALMVCGTEPWHEPAIPSNTGQGCEASVDRASPKWVGTVTAVAAHQGAAGLAAAHWQRVRPRHADALCQWCMCVTWSSALINTPAFMLGVWGVA